MKFQAWHYQWVLKVGLACMATALLLPVLGYVSWWALLAAYVVYVSMAISNSIGFHRLFCHRSYEVNRFWEIILLLTGTLSCYGSSLQWTVVHSQHHRYSDTDRDPHKFRGWLDVFSNNYQLDFRYGIKVKKAIRHLLKKPEHRLFHEWYWSFPIALSLILLTIGGPLLLLYGYWGPVGLTILSAAVFNYISHGPDGPVNTAYYALQSSGEWRHLTHHRAPWSWDLREKWWHPDVGALIISVIRKKT